MEDLNWLANLACDCYEFGEKHGDERVKHRSNELIAAIERDFGLKFKLLLSPSDSTRGTSNGHEEKCSNIIRFPSRLCKDSIRNEDQKDRLPIG
jgi:hypothetical protein